MSIGAGTFRRNGALVRMNADPRFPKDILDVGANSPSPTWRAMKVRTSLSVATMMPRRMCSLARWWKPSLSKPCPVRTGLR